MEEAPGGQRFSSDFMSARKYLNSTLLDWGENFLLGEACEEC